MISYIFFNLIYIIFLKDWFIKILYWLIIFWIFIKIFMCYIKVLGFEIENDFGVYELLYFGKVNSEYICKVYYVERCIIWWYVYIKYYLYYYIWVYIFKWL